MSARNERAVLRTLREQFGLTGSVADAVLDALTDEGFNPNVNTLGEQSAWVTSGKLFDVLDEVEAVQEALARAEAELPDVAEERFLEAERERRGIAYRESFPGVDLEEDFDFMPGDEIEITFSYAEKGK